MLVRGVALVVLLGASCVIGRRPVVVPDGDDPAILLLTCQLSDPMKDIARHAWFAVRDRGGQRWERIETGSCGGGPLAGEGDVILHAVWRGDGVADKIACLRARERDAQPRGNYLPWPGPNSNTFVAHVVRQLPELSADLPPTAIGKDFMGDGLAFGAPPSGRGLQVSLHGLAGLLLSPEEGLEVNLLGLSIGLDPLDLAFRLPGLGTLALPTLWKG